MKKKHKNLKINLYQKSKETNALHYVTSDHCLAVMLHLAAVSVTAHVDDVVGSSVRSMYAISVLRSHGMEASALQQVFRAVVVSKLTYAAPAW